MTESNVTIGAAILELIELYHDDHIEYYKVVVTICAIVGCDPARLLNDKQRRRLEEARERVPARSTHLFQRKEEKNHVTAESPAPR